MDKNAILIELSESARTDSGRVAFASQSPEQRVFSAIWALESQVNNGGFAQYFVSHDGDTAHAAPGALREIGAVRCAEIVTRALETVARGGSLPADQSAREQLVDSLSPDSLERLEALDNEFFSYPDNLTDLLFTFVSRHPTIFGAV